jgi:hypothetical protein
MTHTFKQFIKANDFSCSIFEQDAAPSMSGPSGAPENPDNKTTNKYHFDTIQQQFGIGDEELQAALENGIIPVFQVPDYSDKWGFLVVGPCSATIVASKDGNYEITYQLVQKKLMNPKSFILPYKKGERPLRFNGNIEDKTEIITPEELQDLMTVAYAQPASPPPGGGMM